MKTVTFAVTGAIATLALLAGQGAAAADNEPVDCISLNRIDHTRVVDEQSILFYMRGGEVYMNRLSHKTPGLDRNQPFMYRTSVGRLCNNDTITVLEDWGFGFVQGASTGLGKFVPIDAARAEALEAGRPLDEGIEAVEPASGEAR